MLDCFDVDALSGSSEKQHREIQEMVVDAELHVVENAGHFLPVEQPDLTAELITNWLNSKEEE